MSALLKLREIFPDTMYPEAEVTRTTVIEDINGESFVTIHFTDKGEQLGVSCVVPRGMIFVAAEMPFIDNPCSEIMSNGKESICT